MILVRSGRVGLRFLDLDLAEVDDHGSFGGGIRDRLQNQVPPSIPLRRHGRIEVRLGHPVDLDHNPATACDHFEGEPFLRLDRRFLLEGQAGKTACVALQIRW